MSQPKPGSVFAVTRSLERAKARYPWARARVQVRGRIWCFESEQEAKLYHLRSLTSFSPNGRSRSTAGSDDPRQWMNLEQWQHETP